MKPILYGYWRSSCTWRVRIALAWKGLEFDNRPVNLRAGEQGSDEHRGRSPMAQVPVLVWRGQTMTQSMAILEALEEAQPEPPLLPSSWADRAQARALAEIINAGIQPLQNLSVSRAVQDLGGDPQAWGRDVIQRGLAALQADAQSSAGRFLVGDAPSFADCCLVPQLYNARRHGCDLTDFDLLLAVEARCASLPAFDAAHPDRQPDAPEA